MKIYKKLQKVRVELQDMKLKKTGKNTYSNFTYYELGDFLPAVNALCDKNGIFTHFRIVNDRNVEKAILDVIDSEDESKVTFISPTAEANIGKKKDGTGGADPIQNLGGKITYMRRYLMQMAFEIVESDMVDAVNKELTESMDAEDEKKIENAKTIEDLTKVCGTLKNKYKVSLITPLYEKRREEIQDKVVKVQK